MTHKEKAEELIKKYSNLTITSHKTDSVFLPSRAFAKKCALIAVDEILISVYKINFYEYPYDYSMEDRKHLEYWQEVKQEIEKL